MADPKLCSIPDCGKPALKRGWCGLHYQRWYTHGNPQGGATRKGELLHHLREVVLSYEGNECLTWPYARNTHGYGEITIKGRKHIVSRLACTEENGPAPSLRHHAAHSCGKGHLGCVTKRHLSWKTPTENAADKIAHGTKSCGERHGRAVLTESAVSTIRALRGAMTQQAIADMYGIGRTAISRIHSGKRWGS